jgi:predicted SAM-dependent methyltransferase
MAVYAISNEKFQEMYLKHDDTLKPWPWPEEAAILTSFFLNPIDLDTTPIEELADGHVPPETVRRLLAKLIETGVLVRVDGDTPSPAIPAAARNRLEAHALLSSMASATATIAEDVAAFGDHVLASGSEPGLLEQLRALTAQLVAIRAQLARERAPYLQAQLAKLGVTPETRHLRLHFGVPGLRKLAGWINIEPAPAELAASMTWELPFRDGQVQYVFCAHTLEHIYFRAQALRFLQEVHRTLEPGGVLRVIVPDIGLLVRSYADPSSRLLATRQLMKHYSFASIFKTRLQNVMQYAGTQGRPGQFFHHKYGYDQETLETLLRDAGFATVRTESFQSSTHPPLRIDDQCSAAKHALDYHNFSVFAEAEK